MPEASEFKIKCPILREPAPETVPVQAPVEERVDEPLEPPPPFVPKEVDADIVRKAQTLASLANKALEAQKVILQAIRDRNVFDRNMNRNMENSAITALIGEIGLFAEIFQVEDAVADFVKNDRGTAQ